MIDVIRMLFLACFFISFSGCSKRNETQSVKVRITGTDSRNTSAKISIFKNFSETTLAEEAKDSTGIIKLEFNLEDPCLASLDVGNTFGSEVFLAPGYDLTVVSKLTDRGVQIHFKGVGAEVNNYIAGMLTTIERIKLANGKYISQLAPDDFENRFDSLKTAVNNFHFQFLDSVSIPQNVEEMLQKKTYIRLLSIRHEYAAMLKNNATMQKIFSKQNGTSVDEFEIPPKFDSISDEIIFDTAFINLGSGDYSYLLQTYLINKVYNFDASADNWSAMQYYFPSKANAEIVKSGFPKGFDEYLSAQNIQYWMRYHGITTTIDSIFFDFKARYRSSRYLPALQGNYDDWLAILPGKEAPNFTGFSPDGKSYSLTDFRGKIIYVDIWATWCGPCREEFGPMVLLKKTFAENKNVIFLYVSVDRDVEAWKKMITADKNLDGQHILNDGSIFKSYMIAGIPRYILIDEHGMLVNSNAPRPSSAAAKDAIQASLLKFKLLD